MGSDRNGASLLRIVDFRMMLAPEMRGLGDGFLFSSSCRVRSSLL